MRRWHRVLLSGIMLSASLALAGCADSFDPSETFDKLTDLIPFGTAKKPLPGDRKPVFPDGVPGVSQGIPPELIKGNQPPADQAAPAPADAAQKPENAATKQAALTTDKPKPVKPKKKPPPKPTQPDQEQSGNTAPQATSQSAWPAQSPAQGSGQSSGWPAQSPQGGGQSSGWPAQPPQGSAWPTQPSR